MADDRGDVRLTRAPIVGVAVWASLVAVAVVWPRLRPLPERSGVGAPPFYGRWAWHDVAAIVPTVLVAGLAVWAWPIVATRLRPAALAAATGAASIAWAVLVALAGGVDRLWTPLANKYGYLDVAPDVDAGTFLRTFTERLSRYPTHVKGHPPGLPLLLRALRAIGLGGPGWAAALTLVVWGLGIAAVMVVVHELGGVVVAARASGPLAFLPAVVFAATSADAFFTGATAITIAALVIAGRRTGWGADLGAFTGGALAAGCLHLSYGLAPLALVPVVVMVRERRVRPCILAAIGAAVVVAAFVANGFWLLDGLDATRGFYAEGISQFRPSSYFVFVGNPAALAVALGPVVAAGFGALAARGPRFLWSAGWPLVAVAALVAVIAADLTGLSNGEVERIWLPFMPWIAVAAASLSGRGQSQRWWLASSLGLGMLLQVSLVTPW